MADACQRMLLDTDAGQKLAEFGAKSRDNRSILRDVKKWITEFMDRMRKIFRNVESDSLAAKEFNRFDQNTKQILADMFVDITMDAGEKLSTIKEAGMTEKITTDQGGVRYESRIAGLTDADVLELIENCNRGEYALRTYIPVRKNTPSILLEKSRKPGMKPLEDRPIIMLVEHVQQCMDDEVAANDGKRGHALTAQNILDITKALDEPRYIFYQEDNTKYSLIVEYDTGKRNEKGMAIVDVTRDKNPDQMNGFEGGKYNILVTAYAPESRYLKKYMLSENNKCIYDRKEDALQRSSGSLVPSLLNKSSSITSLAQPTQTVKENDSTKKRSSARTGDAVDRGKLVDLIEQMATDSNEYKALENYRKNIDQMIALEEQVDRLGAEIRKISFAEGPKDTEALKNLKLLRQKAINRLNNYDNILLRLEKSGVLKGLIDRYRAKITQQSFDKAREYYRERNERRENEIRQYYRESRRQAVERHDASQMRQRLKRVVRDLWKLQEIERLYEAYSAVLNVVKKRRGRKAREYRKWRYPKLSLVYF